VGDVPAATPTHLLLGIQLCLEIPRQELDLDLRVQHIDNETRVVQKCRQSLFGRDVTAVAACEIVCVRERKRACERECGFFC